MQLGLWVKVLPRIPQVELDFGNAGASRGRGGALAREPLGPDGGLFVPERTVRPLPRGLPIGLGEFAGGVQVVAVHGVGRSLDHCRDRHGAADGGQVDVLGCACTVAAAGAVFTQQAAVFCVHVAVAQLLGVAGARAPEFAEEAEDLLDEAGRLALRFIVVGQQIVQVLAGFVAGAAALGAAVQRLGLEHALAQAVVGVFGGGCVFALAGAGALLYAAPAKTGAKASRGWSLLALPDLEPNWPLALDRQALPAINLGVLNSCQPNPGGECCAVEAKGKT